MGYRSAFWLLRGILHKSKAPSLSHGCVDIRAAQHRLYTVTQPNMASSRLPAAPDSGGGKQEVGQIMADKTMDYKQKRSLMIKMETDSCIGGKLQLTPEEMVVNDILMKEKKHLMDQSRLMGNNFVPAESFYKSKKMMEDTTAFRIIKQMPKGAALHLHDLSTASLEWLVKDVTYRDNLYFCLDKDDFFIFKFHKNAPCDTERQWKSVKEERAKAESVVDFDANLKKNLSFLSVDPVQVYADDREAWVRFNKYFEQIIGMVFYAPVFRDYIWQSLLECRADNVQYMEIRAQLAGLFDLEGNVYDAEYGLKMYQSVVQDFVKKYPDFTGAKIIMSGLRFQSKEVILEEIKTAMSLHSRYPNFFLGYDLVGEEPNQRPLVYYMDDLLYPSRQNPPHDLPYFFHAGETSWQETSADNNLVDAILLNTTRIGHGYALNKHPLVAKIVKSRDIALEVNPISNQLLGLVKDLRNHPMVGFMASDYPVVISSDDPATWEAAILSHDFYVTFMAMSGETADLRFLKQLILNSLKHSVMSTPERQSALQLWSEKWETFIRSFL